MYISLSLFVDDKDNGMKFCHCQTCIFSARTGEQVNGRLQRHWVFVFRLFTFFHECRPELIRFGPITRKDHDSPLWNVTSHLGYL